MALNALQDSNQVYSAVFARGTLGTADLLGTSGVVAGGADPATGAQYVYNLGPAGSVSIGGTDPTAFQPVRLTDGTSFYNATGAGGGTIVRVEHGTVELVSTVSNITNGTIQVTAGTITSGSIVVTAGTVVNNGGTAGTVTGVGVISALTSGTVSVNTPGTITSGTITPSGGTVGTVQGIGVVTTVTNLSNGTIQSAGTVTGVGVVSALTSGTVSVNTPGTITSGTITPSGGTVGTVPGVGVVTALTSGSVNVVAGTTRDDGRPARNILNFGTVFGGAGTAYGTLIGSASIGVGTSLWVTDLKIMNQEAGTLDCLVGFGTGLTGTTVLDRGKYVAQSGVVRQFAKANNGGMTNTDLVCWIGAAGTISVNVSYFISA